MVNLTEETVSIDWVYDPRKAYSQQVVAWTEDDAKAGGGKSSWMARAILILVSFAVIMYVALGEAADNKYSLAGQVTVLAVTIAFAAILVILRLNKRGKSIAFFFQREKRYRMDGEGVRIWNDRSEVTHYHWSDFSYHYLPIDIEGMKRRIAHETPSESRSQYEIRLSNRVFLRIKHPFLFLRTLTLFVMPSDRERILAYVRKMLPHGKPFGGAYSGEVATHRNVWKSLELRVLVFGAALFVLLALLFYWLFT